MIFIRYSLKRIVDQRDSIGICVSPEIVFVWLVMACMKQIGVFQSMDEAPEYVTRAVGSSFPFTHHVVDALHVYTIYFDFYNAP